MTSINLNHSFYWCHRPDCSSADCSPVEGSFCNTKNVYWVRIFTTVHFYSTMKASRVRQRLKTADLLSLSGSGSGVVSSISSKAKVVSKTSADSVGAGEVSEKVIVIRRSVFNLPAGTKKITFFLSIFLEADFSGYKFWTNWKASSKHYPPKHFDFPMIVWCREKAKGKTVGRLTWKMSYEHQ